jgi:histidyl-tRNA synthetase
VAASFLKAAGLTSDQVTIAVNNRRLMDSRVAALGISADKRGDVFRLIDRRDKMKPAEWVAFATEAGLTVDQLAGIEQMLGDTELWQASDELRRFFAVLEAMGLRDYVRYDAGVIRGLDYYTGTVFEASLLNGSGRAILGGGRYDNLVSDVGGEPLSGVGFAMGDVMISVALRELGLIPKDVVTPAPVLVTVFDEHGLVETMKMATELRSIGLCAAVYPELAKLPKQLKYADRMGMRWAVIAGPDELARGEVTVKDLSSRTQVSLPRDRWAQAVAKMLAEAGRV